MSPPRDTPKQLENVQKSRVNQIGCANSSRITVEKRKYSSIERTKMKFIIVQHCVEFVILQDAIRRMFSVLTFQ